MAPIVFDVEASSSIGLQPADDDDDECVQI